MYLAENIVKNQISHISYNVRQTFSSFNIHFPRYFQYLKNIKNY